MRKILGVAPSGTTDEVTKGYVDGKFGPLLTPTYYSSTSNTLPSGAQFAMLDGTSNAVNAVLPRANTLPAGGVIILARPDSTTHTVNFTVNSADSLVGFTSGGTFTITVAGAIILTSNGSTTWYYQYIGSGMSKSYVDARGQIPSYYSSGAASTNILTSTPQMVFLDGTSSNVGVTLPLASSMSPGDGIIISRYDGNGANTVNFVSNAADSLYGQSAGGSINIQQIGDGIILHTDGVNTWYYQWCGIGEAANIASALMRRDANGRAQVAAPGAAQDILNRDYYDSGSGNGTSTGRTTSKTALTPGSPFNGSVPSGYEGPHYSKIGGVVYVEGTITVGGTALSAGATNTVLTMPSGCRTSVNRFFPGIAGVSPTSLPAVRFLLTATTGVLQMLSPVSIAATTVIPFEFCYVADL